MPLTEDFFSRIRRRMKLLNTTQAAVRLGVSVRRVRALIAEGALRAHQLGREYAIEESALAHVTVYRRLAVRRNKTARRRAFSLCRSSRRRPRRLRPKRRRPVRKPAPRSNPDRNPTEKP